MLGNKIYIKSRGFLIKHSDIWDFVVCMNLNGNPIVEIENDRKCHLWKIYDCNPINSMNWEIKNDTTEMSA